MLEAIFENGGGTKFDYLFYKHNKIVRSDLPILDKFSGTSVLFSCVKNKARVEKCNSIVTKPKF